MTQFSINDKRLWHYRARVTRVIDGDTVECVVDVGFGSYRTERLRLAGVDAPELRPRRGSPEEREEERQLAHKAKARVVELLEGRECLVRIYKTGSFGRWIAQIYHDPFDNTKTINDLLLQEGLAKPYPAR